MWQEPSTWACRQTVVPSCCRTSERCPDLSCPILEMGFGFLVLTGRWPSELWLALFHQGYLSTFVWTLTGPSIPATETLPPQGTMLSQKWQKSHSVGPSSLLLPSGGSWKKKKKNKHWHLNSFCVIFNTFYKTTVILANHRAQKYSNLFQYLFHHLICCFFWAAE